MARAFLTLCCRTISLAAMFFHHRTSSVRAKYCTQVIKIISWFSLFSAVHFRLLHGVVFRRTGENS